MPQKGRKPRVTEEEKQEWRRLHQNGISVGNIAQQYRRDRHTVGKYVGEQDLVAQDVRRVLLAEALRRHFKEVQDFAIALKFQFQPSRLREKMAGLEVHQSAMTAPGGLLGLPAEGPPAFVVTEWDRMYLPPARSGYLLQALQAHCGKSPFWNFQRRWRKEVEPYETASRKLRESIFSWHTESLLKHAAPEDLVPLLRWLFGNALREARIGESLKGDPVGAPAPTGIGDSFLARTKDVAELMQKVRQMAEWSSVCLADKYLRTRQPALGDLLEQIDKALDMLHLQGVSSGRCQLCPDYR